MSTKFFRTIVAPLLALISVFSLTTLPQAQAAQNLTLIAEDSFDYTGNIVGKNGGTGFTNAWTDVYAPSNFYVQSPGMTYSNLTTAGGYIYSCQTTPNQVCGVARNIPTQSVGIVYLQVLVNFGTQYGSGTPNIRFNDASGARVGGLGSNGGTYGAAISILDGNMNPASDGSSSSGTLNSDSFVILRIDHSANVTTMYVNPNMSTFSYFTPPTADAILPNFSPEIKTIEFFARAGVKYDEVKVYRADSEGLLLTSSIPTTFYKGVSATLSATVDLNSKVSFLVGNKKIAGCISKSTAPSAPYTVTCSWKPTVTGSAALKIQSKPLGGALGSLQTLANVGVQNRTTRR